MNDPIFLAFQDAVAGRYSIDRELGRGGMGIVYLARDVQLDRWVAIKVLPPALADQPDLRDRFIREAQTAAKLSHPHIVPIHAVDECGGFSFFVMAYVAGETLAQRVQARGPLSASEATRVLREVAWALGYAHAQGVVHRDVKPDNILLEQQTRRALVADFGIAAIQGDAGGDGVCGTPEFMSPEHALGLPTDARSDLYALGVTAYYILCGRVPFTGTTAAEILARHATEPAPPLARVGAAIPRRVVHAVERCLQKRPDDRPANAQEVADALGAAIEQRRELPAPLRAFVKRNGRTDGGGTLLTLTGALVAGVGISTFTGPITGVVTMFAVTAAAAVGFGLTAARRLLDQGFVHADLAPAFRAEQAVSREERGAQPSRASTIVERACRQLAGIASSTSVVLLVLALLADRPAQRETLGTMFVVGLLLALFPTLGFVVLVQLRRDVDVEMWSRIWTGRIGASAFAVAQRRRGTVASVPVLTHRATELSLGMAAEQLYADLPKSSRIMLGDVPAQLHRLQHDATRLRRVIDEVQDAIIAAARDTHSAQNSALTEQRDQLQRRLQETVAAMESIRLSLLKLHAGSLTLDAFTTQLGRAAELSADIDRMVAAREEVHAFLRFPEQVALTPV